MIYKSTLFPNEYTLVYLKSLENCSQYERIRLSNGIVRDYIKVVSDSNETRLFWVSEYHEDLTQEEKKELIFGKLVMNDYYANCIKPKATTELNERTPFVEYIVPVFKYFSATYKTISFQWCEKGLATNKYVELYSSENSNKRLADGIGFDVVNDREVLLVESSGDKNEDHTKEDTLKLLECSIRALKAEMEKYKFSSLTTFKERRFV